MSSSQGWQHQGLSIWSKELIFVLNKLIQQENLIDEKGE
jgi:hypothetical protein